MSQLKVMEWDAGSKMKGRRVREQKGGGGEGGNCGDSCDDSADNKSHDCCCSCVLSLPGEMWGRGGSLGESWPCL